MTEQVDFGRVKAVGRKARKRDLLLADPDLGEVADKILAVRHGVSHSTVYKARKHAGISSTRNNDYGWAEAAILAHPKLGKVPDMVIAKELCVADTTVCTYRNRAGILPFAPQFSERYRVNVSNKNNDLLRRWL